MKKSIYLKGQFLIFLLTVLLMFVIVAFDLAEYKYLSKKGNEAY